MYLLYQLKCLSAIVRPEPGIRSKVLWLFAVHLASIDRSSMSTYDDLESRIEYQQTLWFRIRQIFFNPEEVDSEEIHRRRQQVVGELETVVSDAEELLADAEETTAKLRQTGRSTTELPGEPVEQIEHVQKVATDLLTAESQYLRSNEQDN